jgi:hypothetical protein
MTLAQSKRANELERALNAWEENRLITSGVVQRRQVRKAQGPGLNRGSQEGACATSACP